MEVLGCTNSVSVTEDATAVCVHISDVTLLHDSVHMLNDGSCCTTETAFSVCQHQQGWPRTIVGASKHGILTCRNARSKQ